MIAKPDDRRDNARKIKENIRNTRQNMEAAEKQIASTGDQAVRDELTAKNERRAQSLDGMKREMKEEMANKKET